MTTELKAPVIPACTRPHDWRVIDDGSKAQYLATTICDWCGVSVWLSVKVV